jgi:hypothetical protein
MVRDIEPSALVAWGAGAAFAVLGSMGIVRLSGIAALDALFVSGALYAALRWRAWQANVAVS